MTKTENGNGGAVSLNGKTKLSTVTTIATNTSRDDTNSNSNSNSLTFDTHKITHKTTHIAPSSSWSESDLTFSQRWTRAIDSVRIRLCGFLKIITHSAATHPWTYVIGITILSIGLVAAGLFTNFELETNGDVLWPPKGSTTKQHQNWIENESRFAQELDYSVIYVHLDGANLQEDALQAVTRAFEVRDMVQALPGFTDICDSPYTDPVTNVTMECFHHGVVDFWWQSKKLFQLSVDSNDEAIVGMSDNQFPYGRDVDANRIYGNGKYDEAGLLTHAEGYRIDMLFPLRDESKQFLSDQVVDAVFQLQEQWDAQDLNSPYKYHLEVLASTSFDDEFDRAVVNDLPLMPAAFIVMSIFCCIVFARWDRVRSQSLLGFGAVVGVLFSIFTSYGIFFLAGVPLTSATQIVVFVMFGIGLDDAFIISGSYSRTDPKKDPVERVADTIDDIGLSIALTTLTSSLAFGLGCISSITAVKWLCLYAFPTIIIDFLYQITFFISLIVIDERRMQRNKIDCLVCIDAGNKYKENQNQLDNQEDQDNSDKDKPEQQQQQQLAEKPSLSSRFMDMYACFLLRPFVKGIVLLAFTALLGACIYGTTQLRQEMDFIDLVPSDSYVKDYFDFQDAHSPSVGIGAEVYFRFVDQSDPVIRQEMKDYLQDLEQNDCIQKDPSYIWMNDFDMFVAKELELNSNNATSLTFNQQLDAFLEDPLYNSLYKNHIVRDQISGNITSSRVEVYMDLELGDSRFLQERLKLIRQVEGEQPMNQGLAGPDQRCFIFEDTMNMWEFYAVVPEELTFTTVVSVVAVSIIGLVFIPHWTAIFFVIPSIVTVYIDLLGLLYFMGVTVNPVSYITLVMSVGLLVDFVMHILLRYYECHGTREERVKETLRTMGSSILVGGISTFLGVMLLAFSTSEIFTTIFRAFIGLVALGIGYGLILLPVVLSIVGPEDEEDYKKMPNTSSTDDSPIRAVDAFPADEDRGISLLLEDIEDEISV
ncbi:Pick C1-like protein 1 [Seminavis robusta]|uniref:Pick C1-like protein 1 n=1 Tax=Seminavis robusta TaxID=568900 RepID=A0A9N8EMU3_9STRA|nr:Pick C1-like protein 1 [Seminavis robusta]|eukprot:Sro1491_g277100.1 Pick C1-like protein 1 (987) ;mRNA; f:10106-13275